LPGSETRKQHQALVLGVLRAAGTSLSKAEIARQVGLSIPTVTEILRGFEADGVVVPTGEGQSSGGRRPMLYHLRTDKIQAIGVNVDHDRITAVISDLSGEISAEASLEVDFAAGDETFVATLHAVVEQLLSAESRATRNLTGIGIAVPTTVRRSTKGHFAPIGQPNWTDVDLPAVLGERYRLPVVVENRAHAVGVGEHLFGAGQGYLDLLCLVVGSGLGAAILAGGKLFTGGDGGAGALGRMRLGLAAGTPPGPTVSDLVGSEGIVRAATDRLRRARRTTLRVGKTAVPIAQITALHVIDAAIAGDTLMAEVLAEVGRVLAAAVAATLCATDSDLVLLCGQTMRAGRLVTDPFREALWDRVPFTLPQIKTGQLGRYAGPLGAAALVLTDHVTDASTREVTR